MSRTRTQPTVAALTLYHVDLLDQAKSRIRRLVETITKRLGDAEAEVLRPADAELFYILLDAVLFDVSTIDQTLHSARRTVLRTGFTSPTQRTSDTSPRGRVL